MEWLAESGMLVTLLYVLGIGVGIGILFFLCACMSNGDAQGRNWPPAGCSSPTRADRKTGFTRE